MVGQYGFHRDRDYVVHEGKIMIVDESTGRMMDGRKWQDGLHQAIESKENVQITAATGQAARITVQNFFQHYKHLAGMTGTAVQVASELYRTFHVRVTAIPTHKPCIRQGLPHRIFSTMSHKMAAIADQIEELQHSGRAILVGTPSVEANSELLGAMLDVRDTPYQILNARFHQQEAEIVSRAGQPGKVTIATNMADAVPTSAWWKRFATTADCTSSPPNCTVRPASTGNLSACVVRQGDPGTYQFFLCWRTNCCDTPAQRCWPSIRAQAVPDEKGELSSDWLSFFRKCQRIWNACTPSMPPVAEKRTAADGNLREDGAGSVSENDGLIEGITTFFACSSIGPPSMEYPELREPSIKMRTLIPNRRNSRYSAISGPAEAFRPSYSGMTEMIRLDAPFLPSSICSMLGSDEATLRLLDAQRHERVIDWFCGLGNFTLPIATQAGSVLGIEGSEALVVRSRENYERNRIRAADGRALAPADFRPATCSS